jgi:segregation and condensation protein A
MAVQEEYKVELEVFEGPLDLLLYLIKKDEIDIYNIPIEKITTQYMEYMNLMRMLDLNIAGEFIVMAATLMMIKSRMLLPVDERPEMEEEEEGEDPRWDLVRRLVEYKKFKDAAAHLQEKEIYQENVFSLGCDGVVLGPEDPGTVLQDVSLFDLITAFNDVLKKAKPEEIGEVIAERFTVADKIDAILCMVSGGKTVNFSELFGGSASRHEIVCTFLALLELIRLRQLSVFQKEHFGEIVITRVENAAEPAPAAVEEVVEAAPEPAAGTAGTIDKEEQNDEH